MRYYRELGNEYVINGKSKVRGATIDMTAHPKLKDRTIKIFSVQEVISQSDTNPILPGMMLGLSFSNMKVNSRNHTWKKDEEKMVPLKLQLVGEQPQSTTQEIN